VNVIFEDLLNSTFVSRYDTFDKGRKERTEVGRKECFISYFFHSREIKVGKIRVFFYNSILDSISAYL
jgi:hypothetical protein